MPDIAGFTLPWPDAAIALPPLPAIADTRAAPGDAAAPPAGGATDHVDIPALLPVPALARAQASDHRDRMASGRVIVAWTGSPTGIPERAALEARFRQLSAIQNLPGQKGADKAQDTLGQLAVRATSDRATLEQLLRVYGYYDAEVTQAVSAGEPAIDGVQDAIPPRVRFDIAAGDRYRLDRIDLPGLAAAGTAAPALRAAYPLHPGDPLDADDIVSAAAHLATALGETGFPFAKLGTPALTVDHARLAGDLVRPVAPGGQYRIGAVVSGRPRFLASDHLARIARFHSSELWRGSRVEDLRRAILATGIVSSVTITPRIVVPAVAPGAGAASPAGGADVAVPVAAATNAGAASVAATAEAVGTPGTVALDVAMTPAPLHTIAAAAGYDTAEGPRFEASWEDRNLFPPEGSLRVRGVLGTDEQLAGVGFRRNNFMGRDRVLSVDLYADNATLTAYAARQVSLSVTFERLTTLIFQKPWTWSVGTEIVGSAEREGVPSGITTGRTNYATVALPLRAGYDASNDFLDPIRGGRISLRVSPEVSKARGRTSEYVRIEGNASWYHPVVPGVVVALRERLGVIAGTELANIAPSRRFYAGGGGSLRGFGYELVGPRNALGEPEGARSVYELSGEVRFHTGLFGGALSLAPFIDAGGAEVQPIPHLDAWREGAGLGLRYASSFGPIRLDVGTPLDPHPGDSRIGVYVSLGQAF